MQNLTLDIGLNDTEENRSDPDRQERIRVDADGDDIDAGFVRGYIEKSFELRNLELKGERNSLQPDADKQGDEFTVLSQILAGDGVGRIENVTLAGGEKARSKYDSDQYASPFSADPAHEGTNFWRGCYVEDFVDNGFYVQNSPGRNVITGCTVKNTSAGSIRLGANDICRDSAIIIDDAPEHNVRGLWLKHEYAAAKENQAYNPRAENVDIYAPDAAGGNLLDIDGKGGIVRNIDIERGRSEDATTYHSTVDVNCDEPVVLENVTVHENYTYAPDEDPSRTFAIDINAPEVTVQNLDLNVVPEENRGGIAFSSRYGQLQNCSVEIPSNPDPSEDRKDAVEVRTPDSSIVNCRFEGGSENSPKFEVYSSVDLDTIHVHGCRFIDVDLKHLTKSDISAENFYRET